jgi:HD-GYP domain-containing protein (c-di-GMP phosphodiesterase class II)
MRIMTTHPALGEEIVRKVPRLSSLLPGVRSHHERWDGKGYPDRLVGEQIPEMARFLALADTFDAMTSNRPYRTALTVEEALREILKCAGTQFHPELALEFVKMIRQTEV